MTNTFLSSFSDVFIKVLAFLSQILHFGCKGRQVRTAHCNLTAINIACELHIIKREHNFLLKQPHLKSEILGKQEDSYKACKINYKRIPWRDIVMTRMKVYIRR